MLINSQNKENLTLIYYLNYKNHFEIQYKLICIVNNNIRGDVSRIKYELKTIIESLTSFYIC